MLACMTAASLKSALAAQRPLPPNKEAHTTPPKSCDRPAGSSAACLCCCVHKTLTGPSLNPKHQAYSNHKQGEVATDLQGRLQHLWRHVCQGQHLFGLICVLQQLQHLLQHPTLLHRGRRWLAGCCCFGIHRAVTVNGSAGLCWRREAQGRHAEGEVSGCGASRMHLKVLQGQQGQAGNTLCDAVCMMPHIKPTAMLAILAESSALLKGQTSRGL